MKIEMTEAQVNLVLAALEEMVSESKNTHEDAMELLNVIRQQT